MGTSFQLEPFSPHARRRGPVNANESAYKLALRCYTGRMSIVDLERLAIEAWDVAGLCTGLADPRWLLFRHGVRYRPGKPGGTALAQLLRRPRCDAGGRALVGPDGKPLVDYCVIYRPRLARRSQGLALLHEFAHRLLDGYDHDERDVWMLTLMLAFPHDELKAIEQEDGWTVRSLARHQLFADTWALRERAWVARLIYREAA